MEPPAGIEPATPSLPWIGGQAPCYPAYLQVTRYRKGRSYGASWRAYLAARHSLIPFKVTASMIPAGTIVLTEVDRWTSFPRPSRGGPGRSAWGATEVAALWWWQRGSSVSREE